MATRYTTHLGEMWDEIAKSQMGDERYMSVLMKANPDYSHYNIFPAGIVLTVPSVKKTVLVNLPPWRR